MQNGLQVPSGCLSESLGNRGIFIVSALTVVPEDIHIFLVFPPWGLAEKVTVIFMPNVNFWIVKVKNSFLWRGPQRRQDVGFSLLLEMSFF